MKGSTTPITTPKSSVLPRPPAPGNFELTWHKHRGYWQKKYKGHELRYERDPGRSYTRWLEDKAAIDRNDQPAVEAQRYLLKDAINVYLTRQARRHAEGELSKVQMAKCRRELETKLPKAIPISTPLAAFRASRPGDDGPAQLFHQIKTKALARGLQVAHRHIVLVRACLDYAAGEKKIMLPPDYGDDFNPPSQRRIDRWREDQDAELGERMWTPEELGKIIAGAKALRDGTAKTKRGGGFARNPHLYAQILLALFGGCGSDDLSAMSENALDRKLGVIKYRRAKNGKAAVFAPPAVVWEAIEFSVSCRAPAATPEAARLLFRTSTGRKCNQSEGKSDEKGVLTAGRNDTIQHNFKRLVSRLDLRRHRAGFKTLRAMCRTMMSGAGVDEDFIAAVMGRRLRFPADQYYLRGEKRSQLQKLAGHIEGQLFSPIRIQ